MNKWIFGLCVLVALAIWAMKAICSFGGGAGGIDVEDAFMRLNGVSGKSGAAFMVIENDGPNAVLVGASANFARRVELHESKTDANGVVSMAPLENGIALPSGDEVALARGGMHVMLMGLDQGLAEGQEVEMILIFDNAPDKTVKLTIDQSR